MTTLTIKKTTKEDLKVIYDNGQGVHIESRRTGLLYDLYEGIGYKGTASSDITFLMVCSKEKGQLGLLQYLYGASDLEGTIQGCIETIIDFENHSWEPLHIMGTGLEIIMAMNKSEEV